jgi:hypothetical protein
MRKLLLIQLALCFAIVAKAQTFTSSNLPIVIINTDGNATIPDEPKIGASMKIIYHPDGGRNYMSDQSNPLLLKVIGDSDQV